jgi:hypothetical protein
MEFTRQIAPLCVLQLQQACGQMAQLLLGFLPFCNVAGYFSEAAQVSSGIS